MKKVLIHSETLTGRDHRKMFLGVVLVAFSLMFLLPSIAVASTGSPDGAAPGIVSLFGLIGGAIGMQLVKSANYLDGQVMFYLPEGKYAGLFVRIAGTNQAAQTLALTQLGTLRIQHNNVEIFNTRPSNLISLTNLYLGTPESASAAGGAFTYSFIVPFRTKLDQQNILPVVPQMTQFVLQGFAGVATVLSGTIEVYALYSKEGIAKYVPMFKEANMIFAAAATQQNEQLPSNVEQLYCVSDAAISQLQVTRDNYPEVDGTFAAIDALSDAQNRVETGVTFVELIAPRTPFLQYVQQTRMRVTTTGAIAELVVAYFAAAEYEQAA